MANLSRRDVTFYLMITGARCVLASIRVEYRRFDFSIRVVDISISGLGLGLVGRMWSGPH